MQPVQTALLGLILGTLTTTASAQTLVGHRGASFDAPENTLAAFKLAWEQGADGAEGDYYLSSDGKIICIHDGDTKRTAGVKLPVSSTPFDKLRALDVGSWKGDRWKGEPMPTLAEMLASVPKGKVAVIELKVGPEIVQPMLDTIRASGLDNEQIAVISFNGPTLAEVERLAPEIRTHWLSGYKEQHGQLRPTADEVIAAVKKYHADGFGSEARMDHFNKAFIDKLQASGCREFHVWTVDNPEVAAYYNQLGPKWITTNRPAWLREQLKSSAAAGKSAAKSPPPAGYTALFNGHDLSGWKGLAADPPQRAKMTADELAAAQARADARMREHWKVVDGVLEFDGEGDNLCTATDYGNCELLVDWKITPKADSGIYLRGTPQVQIWDTANPEAWQHGADKGSGGLWNNKQQANMPLAKADRPAGEWNTMYIKLVDDRVTVKLNGQLVVDNVVLENYWQPGEPLPASGPIELQNHGNKLWFRNLYVREL